MLAAHPELTAARVKMEAIEIGQGEYTPTGQFEWPYLRRRLAHDRQGVARVGGVDGS